MIVGIKSGRWELIHRAHIETLKECAAKCDKLIVLVHNCKDKPSYMNAQDRKYIIEQIKCVDKVFVYSYDTEDDLIKELKQELYMDDYVIMFHSEELQGKTNIPGNNYVQRIEFIKRKKGSTSELVERIKND